MRIIIAPDSFKESLSAKDVCSHIERGIKRADPKAEVLKIPLSDGGEGALETLNIFVEGKFKSLSSVDPVQRPIVSRYFLFEQQKTAWIELASASGLSLISKKERNPLITNTFGTGLLIKDALESGCSKIILGIGGSATNDGGTGIVAALGGQFLTKKGNPIFPSGKNMHKIEQLHESEMMQKLNSIEFIIASDVSNPLTGDKGCSRTYAPQKGAKPKDIQKLENGMIHFAKFLKNHTGIEWDRVEGGGAAGGTGAGISALLGGIIKSGFEVLSEIIDLETKIRNSDLLITGEGKYDEQSAFGKLVFRISEMASQKNIPVIVLAGIAEEVDNPNVTAVFSIADRPMKEKIALERTGELLEKTAYQIAKIFKT